MLDAYREWGNSFGPVLSDMAFMVTGLIILLIVIVIVFMGCLGGYSIVVTIERLIKSWRDE